MKKNCCTLFCVNCVRLDGGQMFWACEQQQCSRDHAALCFVALVSWSSLLSLV